MLRFISILVVIAVLVAGCFAPPMDAKQTYISEVEKQLKAFDSAFNTICVEAFDTNGISFMSAIYNPKTIEKLNDCVAQLKAPILVLQELTPPAEYAPWHKRMLTTNLMAFTYLAAVADAAERKDKQTLMTLHKPALVEIPDYPWRK